MRDEELEREFDAGRGRRAEGYLEGVIRDGFEARCSSRFCSIAGASQDSRQHPAVVSPRRAVQVQRGRGARGVAGVVSRRGDVLRHLALMGYGLYHSQEPIREYDFRVKNLAVDLRDGVRLCRLVDVLGERRGDDSAVAAARSPRRAAPRNCTTFASRSDAAAKLGVELPRIGPAETPRTWWTATRKPPGLLYALQMHFQAPKLIPKATLDEETEAWRERRREMIVSGLGGGDSTPRRSRPPRGTARTISGRGRARRDAPLRGDGGPRHRTRGRRGAEARTRRDCFDGREPSARASASR